MNNNTGLIQFALIICMQSIMAVGIYTFISNQFEKAEIEFKEEYQTEFTEFEKVEPLEEEDLDDISNELFKIFNQVNKEMKN